MPLHSYNCFKKYLPNFNNFDINTYIKNAKAYFIKNILEKNHCPIITNNLIKSDNRTRFNFFIPRINKNINKNGANYWILFMANKFK